MELSGELFVVPKNHVFCCKLSKVVAGCCRWDIYVNPEQILLRKKRISHFWRPGFNCAFGLIKKNDTHIIGEYCTNCCYLLYYKIFSSFQLRVLLKCIFLRSDYWLYKHGTIYCLKLCHNHHLDKLIYNCPCIKHNDFIIKVIAFVAPCM